MLTLALGVTATATAQPPRKVEKALMTFYWVINEASPRYSGPANAVLYDERGHVLARTPARFLHDLLREGTGWLRDGRTVAYQRTVRGQHQFRMTGSRYGLARTGSALSPYRSVAVDPRVIKLGSRLYIPQLKGTRLPDGSIHDGIFVASDSGGFRGRHVDVFVGAGADSSLPFVRNGYGSRSRVTLYVVD